MSDLSANLALPYMQPSQAQKHVTHNEALERLDVLAQLCLEAFDTVTPPGAPVEGEAHGVGAGAGGAWAGQDGRVAAWLGGAWVFIDPATGWRAWGRAEAELRVWDGATWAPAGGDLNNLGGVGIGTSWDATNRLAVTSEAALFTHAGAGHQLKINKAGISDTASLLYQTNWSGRAEMGLTGNDDFAVKVSDGSNWFDAISVDHTTGAVAFPSGLNGTGSAAGPMGGQIVVITGERNSNFATGQYMSIGNGATDTAGPAMPFAGKIIGASISAANGAAGSSVLSLAVNRVEQTSHQVTLSYSGSGVETASANFTANPLPFAAGDAINLYVNTAGTLSEVVTAIFLIFD